MAVVVYSEANGYGTTEVAEAMGMSPHQVRSFVYAGLLDPVRGPRQEYLFSFQDLVLLRMGAQLKEAKVPLTQVRRALHELREQLSEDLPLSAIKVDALGDTVIARDREGVWAPETGQRYFAFTLPPSKPAATEELAAHAPEPALPDPTADEWFNRAVDLEASSHALAKDAYRKVLELDGEYADAHANLGRLYHAEGRVDRAVQHFSRAAELDPVSGTPQFNLGVALEDLNRTDEAIVAYQRALERDPRRADAHFNLSRLFEARNDEVAALRHLKEYRRLSRGGEPEPGGTTDGRVG